MVVFLADGYFKIREDQRGEEIARAKRFFKMASTLPMDLQMALCNRRFGLGGLIVKVKFSEKGFKKFARW